MKQLHLNHLQTGVTLLLAIYNQPPSYRYRLCAGFGQFFTNISSRELIQLLLAFSPFSRPILHRPKRRPLVPPLHLRDILLRDKSALFSSCSICLEPLLDGQRLLVLPCGHIYHCACIDLLIRFNVTSSSQPDILCPTCGEKWPVRWITSKKTPRKKIIRSTNPLTPPRLETMNEFIQRRNGNGTTPTLFRTEDPPMPILRYIEDDINNVSFCPFEIQQPLIEYITKLHGIPQPPARRSDNYPFLRRDPLTESSIVGWAATIDCGKPIGHDPPFPRIVFGQHDEDAPPMVPPTYVASSVRLFPISCI